MIMLGRRRTDGEHSALFPALAPGDSIKPQPRRVPRRPSDRAVPGEEGAPAGIQILTGDGIDDLQAPERPKQVPRLHVESWVDVRELGSSAQHHGQSLSRPRSEVLCETVASAFPLNRLAGRRAPRHPPAGARVRLSRIVSRIDAKLLATATSGRSGDENRRVRPGVAECSRREGLEGRNSCSRRAS